LEPFSVQRRDPGPHDVQIDVAFCGVCHSDLHQARNEWNGTTFPCVPGHEIVGRVVGVGSAVGKFREGDMAAIGCMVDSCRRCPSCLQGEEQFCEMGPVFTYNSPDAISGGMTYGGYSQSIVADEAFVLQVPAHLDAAASAPLLCAGITTYSPLRRWNVGKGKKVGVVGLGGLGHMAVKLACAMGARVVLFTTSSGKVEDAVRLGASEVVISSDARQMNQHRASFDFILDTVSAAHALGDYMPLLKRSGTLTLIGAPPEPLAVSAFDLIFGGTQLAGSLIGGIRETQEMLDFCGEHNITSDIELIPIDQINAAFERLLKGDVKYRFVIDLATLN
jgi:uncharacterized zinc-type alcohol dehydrogenase-like protein